jgi:hypothetical protein
MGLGVNMPSVNVYVSKELRARMQAAKLNWSQIAAAAFQRAIQRDDDSFIGRFVNEQLSSSGDPARLLESHNDRE